MKKLFNTLWVTACLLLAAMAIPPSLWANTAELTTDKMLGKNIMQPGNSQNSVISLEKAIYKAKEMIPVPEELDQFSSDYQEYNGNGRWMLRWYKTDPPDANMYIVINPVTGEVEGMNYYSSVVPGTRYKGLPAFNQEQCLKIAQESAAKLQTEKYSSTVLVPQDQWLGAGALRERDYPIFYHYTFRRTVDGIPVADQGINIGVNADTGKVERFDLSWNTDVNFPSSKDRISTDQARKIFMEKAGYELTYFMPYKGSPDVTGELRLVYRPKPPGRFIINAVTGELMNNGMIDFYINEANGYGGDQMSRLNEKALSPAEREAVKETRDLITAEQAQEIARQLLGVPEGYTVKGRNLERQYSVPGSRIWSIQFSDAESNNWIRISVDARNGDLISFNKEERINPEDGNKESQIKISEVDAQKKAWGLIEKLQSERAQNVVLRQTNPEMGPWIKAGIMPPARAYIFQYARIVNGIVYPENGFMVRVSAETGEVTSYEVTWWETVFPPIDGVIGTASANKKFLAKHPLILEYTKGYNRWAMEKETAEYFLIYRPTSGSGAMLDAVSGQEIDFQGNPIIKTGKRSFTDISGHPAEKDIMLLSGEGIVAGDGSKFRPDDPVTVAETLSMLVKAYNHRGPVYPMSESGSEPWYNTIVQNAKAMGILDESFSINPESNLSRLVLSRLGINAAGWGKLARISEIFKLDVADFRTVPLEYRGYVSAAVGMNLIKTENGKFNPHGAVTRAEAATFLVNLLNQ